jgi:beta-lactamase superfamily II metal-dependent hydrolase
MLGLLLLSLFSSDPLIVRLIDVEGGGGTLIITPARESILIDCGNPGARDAGRIAKAIRNEGLNKLDHLVITHWHVDHYGGAETLAGLIPITHFWDRGIPERLAEDPGNFPGLIAAYSRVSKRMSRTLKPGDQLPLRQVEGAGRVTMTCVCASGNVIEAPSGATANSRAGALSPMADDPSDNARSLGFVLSLGNWRYLNLGDLTWNTEAKLVHPVNRLGEVDLYQSTHHGASIPFSPASCTMAYSSGPSHTRACAEAGNSHKATSLALRPISCSVTLRSATTVMVRLSRHAIVRGAESL